MGHGNLNVFNCGYYTDKVDQIINNISHMELF